MTSPYARPDVAALHELERVLEHLTQELAAWRRRCQKAETELQALKGQGGMVLGDDVAKARSRMLELERDNLDLGTRVDRARELVNRLQHRLDLLEDGHAAENGP